MLRAPLASAVIVSALSIAWRRSACVSGLNRNTLCSIAGSGLSASGVYVNSSTVRSAFFAIVIRIPLVDGQLVDDDGDLAAAGQRSRLDLALQWPRGEARRIGDHRCVEQELSEREFHLVELGAPELKIHLAIRAARHGFPRDRFGIPNALRHLLDFAGEIEYPIRDHLAQVDVGGACA